MIKIRHLEDCDKYAQEISKVLVNVLGDLITFQTVLSEEYYNKEEAEQYGPMIVIMDDKEYERIEKLIPTIVKDDYETCEIVSVDKNEYIRKYCYLFNNGESGIMVYVHKKFKHSKRAFEGNVYITSSLNSEMTDELRIHLLALLETARIKLDGDLDYLQVFKIKNKQGKVEITHTQEVPEYKKVVEADKVVMRDCTIFWISDEDENGVEHSTLMLAEDY